MSNCLIKLSVSRDAIPGGLVCLVIVLAGVSRVGNAQAERFDKESFFEKKIRPVLEKHCLDCHGGDDPSGKLRLDSRAGWQVGGERGPAIAPGDPVSSLMIRAIRQNDPKLKMPPDGETSLSGQEILDLEKWIRQGAHDPRNGTVVRPIDLDSRKHWAFQPVKIPLIPSSTENPIDFLLNKKLRERGLRALGIADARTLARRAVFDLHGLPPSEKQLELARSDYGSLIDDLLSSPRYGERWGRHWLDVARYSDAKDGVLMYGDARIRPFAYTYRDYVIRSFNQDRPYDEFIKQQIAADQMQLGENSPDLAALGLLTLGRMFDRNQHDVIDDQIDVISRGFLGLTASCARCHDHKFDPIPTADYYSLYGVFASIEEPLDRPRISEISDAGKKFESEIVNKLKEIQAVGRKHYEEELRTARKRLPDYLAHVASTKPDFAETAIFFLSLTPDQLRPQMVHRWREYIARHAHPDDPVFAPWHDLMKAPELQVDRWKKLGVDPRIVEGLQNANPKNPEEIGRAYGKILLEIWNRKERIKQVIVSLENELQTIGSRTIRLADVVAGGTGSGNFGKKGGIHPGTGKQVSGGTGFIKVPKNDQLIPVKNPLVDGIFVPRSNRSVISTTGLVIDDLRPGSGQTWDYFKNSVSTGSTEDRIDGIQFSQPPHSVLALHANKGITFDLKAMRDLYSFRKARFRGRFGHSGAAGQSKLDFAVYLDGQRVLHLPDFPAQGKGRRIDIPIQTEHRFLTLVVTEGQMGISHDQAILGDARIEIPQKDLGEKEKQRIALIQEKIERLKTQQKYIADQSRDPLFQLVESRESPFWFPENQIGSYLSRRKKDAFRGLKGQVDAIAIRHPAAADRAMIVRDRELPFEPVIFQRGDPGMQGNPVPRRFFQVLQPDRQPFQNGSGRLELAAAIASAENPLTARVWVNRVWMHHFGTPLVANPSDFGLRAERPVQLELLDFLAAKLMQNGWRTKPIHRLIMTSNAYRRSSLAPVGNLFQTYSMNRKNDPENGLYWKFNRRRLDLETLRDGMLMISGALDLKMFGRPLLITDPRNRRRTVYAFVERQGIPDFVKTFDFANADTSTARRVETTVPQQALFAMNSRFFHERIQEITRRVDPKKEKPEQVAQLYRLIFQRSPTVGEFEMAKEYLKEASLQEWVHVLLMTNEFMFID